MSNQATQKSNQARPARSYIARAIPARGGGFYAQWAAPGLIPDLVYDRRPIPNTGELRDGGPLVFEHENAATATAMATLFNALNSRKRVTSPDMRYAKMWGPDFAAELSDTGLTVSEFALLWGTFPDRILSDWIDEASPRGVPFPMWWVLELLKDPATRQKALEIAAKHVQPRSPRATADSGDRQ
jgi:hypothetical protein